jgi:hypothetical protein
LIYTKLLYKWLYIESGWPGRLFIVAYEGRGGRHDGGEGFPGRGRGREDEV